MLDWEPESGCGVSQGLNDGNELSHCVIEGWDLLFLHISHTLDGLILLFRC